MYFDFEDRYTDIEPVGHAINTRDGVAVSVLLHVLVLAAMLALVGGAASLREGAPGYAGIRSKISGPGEPAADFVIQGPGEHGVPGLVQLFGIESPGLTASLAVDGRARAHRLGIHPSLSAVVCIPDFELSTKKARGVLPETVYLADSVFNTSRALLLTKTLESGHVSRLPELMKDRLHQPYRAKLVPGLEDALAAAVEHGAAGAALSGSGPTVFAFVEGRNASAGEAMVRAFSKHGVASRWLALPVDHQGVRVER